MRSDWLTPNPLHIADALSLTQEEKTEEERSELKNAAS